MSERPSPYALWRQSCDEHPQGSDAQRTRYRELLLEHGHIILKDPTAHRPVPDTQEETP
jgi:hypothetical protein